MRKSLLSFVFLIVVLCGQDHLYGDYKVAITNFLVRMYNNAPFDGGGVL